MDGGEGGILTQTFLPFRQDGASLPLLRSFAFGADSGHLVASDMWSRIALNPGFATGGTGADTLSLC
jgi:hypothetical protein